MLRTIYGPCLRAGASKTVAGLVVFSLSAAMHEYAIAIPLRMLCWWAFIGMMLQIPAMHISQRMKGALSPTIGNCSFWLSFCVIGAFQP